nr:lamin tail domain-containing protein [Candidatus Hydrogenedentota bacterium]
MGGYRYNEYPSPILDENGDPTLNYKGWLVRALNEGATPYEYETRMLPDIGVVLSARMWGLLTGSPQGMVFPPYVSGATGMPAQEVFLGDMADQFCLYDPPNYNYAYDVCLPGYGRVDDNANALLLCFNGRDDDGDGMIDEGVNPAYPEYLGLFEGIDEPGEMQRLAALRNFLAEQDATNNEYFGNGDTSCPGQADEIGELGDKQLNKPEEIMLAYKIGDATYGHLKNLITTFSTDRNVEFMEDAEGNQRTYNRLDFNHSTAQQIASDLLLSQDIHQAVDSVLTAQAMSTAETDLKSEILSYMEGLRQNAVSLGGQTKYSTVSIEHPFGTEPLGSEFVFYRLDPAETDPDHWTPFTKAFPADGVISALQLSVNAIDDRDTDYARTVLTTDRVDTNPGENAKLVPPLVAWPPAEQVNARETVPENMKFAIGEVQQELQQTMGDTGRVLESPDDWWKRYVFNADPDAGIPEGEIPREERLISNTVAGNEAIRINELMVRPVRRIEAEAVTHVDPPVVPERISLVKLRADNPSFFYGLMDPATTPDYYYYRNYFPTPYPQDLNIDITRMPYFDIQEMDMGVDVDPDTGQIIPDSYWFDPRTANNFIGSGAAFITTTQNDVIQFVIRGTEEGLPEGRYYLAVNMTDEDGIPTVTDADQLEYAIKYVEIDTATGLPMVGSSTILEDIFAQYDAADPDATEANLDVYFTTNWSKIAAYQISHHPGEPEGWVFIDGTPIPDLAPNKWPEDPLQPKFNPNPNPEPGGYYFSDGGTVAGWEPAAGNPETHTVTIPPLTSDMALCVAFRKVKDDGKPLAINFLDFSQEPDHEWVELTNVSDVEVDLSGWQLEVGIPDPANASLMTSRPTDTFKSVWTIPEGTLIAPHGYLLLSFESDQNSEFNGKYDKYQTINGTDPALGQSPFTPTLLNTNGIGLEKSDVDPGDIDNIELGGVTAPPFADASSDIAEYPEGELYDPTGSVFERNGDADPAYFMDYVDNNGDGVTSGYLVQQAVASGWAAVGLNPDIDSRTDHVREYTKNDGVTKVRGENDIESTEETAIQGSDKPWDRIVSLYNESIWREDPLYPNSSKVDLYSALSPGSAPEQALKNLSRIVLQGGFLPNYPEHDGIDNDGDGGYLIWDTIDLDGDDIPDDVDGDGNVGDVIPRFYIPGTLDKDMVDNDLDGFVDERGDGWDVDHDGFVLPFTLDIPFSPFRSEGVDEGIGVNAGDFGAGVLPITFLNNRFQDLAKNNVYTGTYPSEMQWAIYTLPNATDDRAPLSGDEADPYRFWVDAQEIDNSLYETVAYGDMSNPLVWDFTEAGWAVVGGALEAQDAPGEAYQDPNNPDMIDAMDAGDILPLVNGGRYMVSYTVGDVGGVINGAFQIVLGDDDNGLKNKGMMRIDPGGYIEELTCEAVAKAMVRIVADPANPDSLTCAITNLSVFRVDDFWKAVDARHSVTAPVPDTYAESEELVSRLGDYAEDQAQLPADQLGITDDALYLGSDADPPDWKAFVERRWYPGDNVTVTLYEGTTLEGKVADRVTYREFDVTNRTIDDMVDCPYFLDGVNLANSPDYTDSSGVAQPEEIPTLRPGLYTSLWLPDQMALDFYRSLERKHPLYNGDRFGTSNRWEATDGNYDDWSDSLSPYTAVIDFTQVNNGIDYPNFATVAFTNRFQMGMVRDEYRLFGHALDGSPLRMNMAERIMENPADLVRLVAAKLGITVPSGTEELGNERPESQFIAGDWVNMGASPSNSSDGDLIQNLDWSSRELYLRNQSLRSNGDLARLPMITFQHRMLRPLEEEPFLYDMTHLNYGFYRESLSPNIPDSTVVSFQDTSLQGVMVGQSNDVSVPWVEETVDAMAMNPIILPVGLAELTPIRPNPNPNTTWVDTQLQYADGTFTDLLQWKTVFSGTTPDCTGPHDLTQAHAPAAWMPVFLFELPGDSDLTGKTNRQFPYYSPFPEGYSAMSFLLPGGIQRCYMYNTDYLFSLGTDGTAFAGMLGQAELAQRWSLEKRAFMYVSEVRENVNQAHRPEALFTWDAGDGLENGEYYVCVGTYIPGMGNALEEAWSKQSSILSAGTGAYCPFDLLAMDPDTLGNIQFEPRLGLEVITDRTRAQGQAPKGSGDENPGLAHPEDWTPNTVYTPGLDGLIIYGTSGTGSLKPQVVRVTDNFLALRVRNMGQPGQVAAITHVVLTPRKRAPGRININTVQDRVVRLSNPQVKDELFNPLMGLPGVANVLRTVSRLVVDGGVPQWEPIGRPYEPDDEVDLPSVPVLPANNTAQQPWTSPDDLALSVFGAGSGKTMAPRQNYSTDGYQTATDFLGEVTGHEELAAQRLSALIMSLRPRHVDGRYYEKNSDLTEDQFFPDSINPNQQVVFKPLSNDASSERRFDEAIARFTRMANSITVRSDVFQVIATVQAGYGIDYDGNGVYDYRGQEFVTTAETKSRMVYERRTPALASDQVIMK